MASWHPDSTTDDDTEGRIIVTKEQVVKTTTAWQVIGYDGPDSLRVVGGRALYDAAIYYDDTRGTQVKLARLDATAGGLRQVNRYVSPDTQVEIVRAVA